MQHILVATAGDIVVTMAERIIANKAYLSEIDGKIGDGDHGVNMAKGFAMTAERLRDGSHGLSQALDTLGTVLMTEIGGSMGPLYGALFTGFAEALRERDAIDADAFGRMLHRGLDEVLDIGGAKQGDKTMLDSLIPATRAFDAAVAAGQPFAEALRAMSGAAEAGRDSTIDMVARIGRASRLGERSRGVLDAGATSCALLLMTLADGAGSKLVS